MSEWEDKLNTLLSDPNAMAQVMQMAQSLSQQMGASGSTASSSGDPTAAADVPPPQELSSLLGGVDPALIQRLLPLLSQINRIESSETSAFLLALRPFLKPERRDKVERAVQLARLIHLGKLFLLSQEG